MNIGMRRGCGRQMGPGELPDCAGLDTSYFIGNIMYEEFREMRFQPPPRSKRMVMAGRLGRTTGQGFYA